MREVTSQELNDCGINPFACTLLVESWKGHPSPKPVAFLVRGVKFALGYDPHELEAENARLRAVADAARTLLRTQYDTDAYAAAWEGLWEAVDHVPPAG